MRISLQDMHEGDTGRIVSYNKSFLTYRQKLLAMGLTPGTEFTVVRIAPLGDPIEIRIRGTDLSLRKNEVSALKIERIAHRPKEHTPDEEITVAVIGNPNCGKTTLFNGLTGANQHVGNWAGVTVEQKTGQYQYDHKIIKVVDLPGLYSLDVNDQNTSLDEKVAREFILSQQADLIINIIDTTHLEHNLYLTIQLLEMKLPLVIVFNEMDDITGRDIQIDYDEISRRLHCPVVALSATQAAEIQSLKATINRLVESESITSSPVEYPKIITTAIDRLKHLIAQKLDATSIDTQWLAIKLLEKDDFAMSLVDSSLQQAVANEVKKIETETSEDTDILIVDSRYSFINTLTQDTLIQKSKIGRELSDKIDKVILNRFLGIPIFFTIMYFMFTFTIKLGRVFKPFFKETSQTIFVDGFGYLLSLIETPSWLIALLAGGIGGGIREVLSFVPILGFLYLFISILEESGYMARATFVMDRFMHSLSLPGKAFVPLILGFGCNVPAMMATRILERPRDRLLTILLNPFMTCGARLAVFTLFAAAFFPENAGVVVFSLYLIGIGFALITALLLKHTFLKEEFSLVIMEIPSYHIPKLKNVWINSWTRIKAFIFRVGKIIISMVLVLHILSNLGTDGSFKEHNIERSVLSAAGRSVTPLLKPMGIDQDNWPATVAVFTGILHKVVVISTLKSIYKETPGNTQSATKKTFAFWKALKQAALSIPLGFKKMLGFEPPHSGMTNTPFVDALHKHFHGQIGAYAYLLFVLLYFPCIATTSTAYKESTVGWSIFMVVWSTGLAYLMATLFYQLATFQQHPETTMGWVTGSIIVAASILLSFFYWGKRQKLA